jgi:hypothetical protein
MIGLLSRSYQGAIATTNKGNAINIATHQYDNLKCGPNIFKNSFYGFQNLLLDDRLPFKGQLFDMWFYPTDHGYIRILRILCF